MPADSGLLTWLRQVANEYRFDVAAVYRHDGIHEWPLKAKNAEDLAAQLLAGDHFLPLPKEPAALANGSFWHGHPSKWQPNRWKGYWDEKIKRNMARDAMQNAALAEAGWTVIRLWDFEIEQDPNDAAQRVISVLPT